MYLLAHNFELPTAVPVAQYCLVGVFKAQEEALVALKQVTHAFPETVRSLTVRRARCLEDESDADAVAHDKVFVLVQRTTDASMRGVFRYVGYFYYKANAEACVQALQQRAQQTEAGTGTGTGTAPIPAPTYFLVGAVAEPPVPAAAEPPMPVVPAGSVSVLV